MLRLQFKIWVGLYLLKLKGACGVVIPTLGWWRTRPADPTTWGWPRTQWEIKHVRGFIMQSGFNSPPHQLRPQCPVNNMFVHMGRSFLTGVHIRRLPERLGDSAPLVLVDRTPPNGLTWVALNKIWALFFHVISKIEQNWSLCISTENGCFCECMHEYGTSHLLLSFSCTILRLNRDVWSIITSADLLLIHLLMQPIAAVTYIAAPNYCALVSSIVIILLVSHLWQFPNVICLWRRCVELLEHRDCGYWNQTGVAPL